MQLPRPLAHLLLAVLATAVVWATGGRFAEAAAGQAAHPRFGREKAPEFLLVVAGDTAKPLTAAKSRPHVPLLLCRADAPARRRAAAWIRQQPPQHARHSFPRPNLVGVVELRL
ncbi:hypothetical protein [Opitutus sp. ER46]|uniref:hypothetical protein n=1 Tax=Opitutus sp. ER46 TaxID=2161864 RepID=UPI000D2F8FD3|nr:hypothetical protein [Opitutus sp. ER46]PTX91537.1 hypothetical protein DB354_16795 [Opitutus sp. ER46]